jgi:hypothetical protein
MKKKTANEFLNRLDSIEFDVIETLKQLIFKSDIFFNNLQVIEVDIFGYKYITISNNDLVFIDENQYEYSLFADCTLLDLIEIIKKHEK